RVIFASYLIQILALALAGIAGGLLLGGLVPAAIAPLLSELLPAELRLGIYPLPLAIAALSGLLTVLVFSLWPLAAIGQLPAGALFRDGVPPAPRPGPPLVVGT